MFKVSSITSPANSRVKQLVRLRQHRHRRAAGQFIAEGTREVNRALTCGYHLDSLYLCPQLLDIPDDNDRVVAYLVELLPVLSTIASACECAAFTVSRSVFGKIAYRQNPQGLVAVFQQKAPCLSDICESRSDDLFLVSVGPSKPGNIGAMARSAAAAGCTAILLADAPVDIYNPNAIRASTGAVFSEIIVAAPGQDIRNFLQNRGVKIIAAAPPTAGDNPDSVQQAASGIYHQVDMTGPIALVIGSEDQGLDSSWTTFDSDRHGVCVSIPMAGEVVDSLNASTAAAILLFEATRQRTVS